MKRLIIFLLVFVALLAVAQRAVPTLWGHYVHDEAHVLSQQTVDELELMLKRHEDSTSNQVVVLIIPSLEGEELESYTLRVAEKNELGMEKHDNGVLLLIAIDDRKMRIEVGYGLEGALPDAICNRIIRNEIAPNFRKQDYDKGVTDGINAIFKAIRNEYVSDEETELAGTEMSAKERIFIGLFVFGILGVFTFVGLFVEGCSGWFLYAFLIPFYATFPLVILGATAGVGLLIGYVIGFPVLKLILRKSSYGKRMAASMNKKRGGGGWSSGSGWTSGGGGWSSGGGGGFSGGGGSFGGGGSSGSW